MIVDSYLGEIRLFAGAWEPDGFYFCDGRLLPIGQYQALYSLIGITWGGDQVKNFALPDLRGRLAIGQGQGIGLTNRVTGRTGGTEAVTMIGADLPAHNHAFNAVKTNATTTQIGSTMLYAATADGYLGYTTNATNPAPTAAVLDQSTISTEGGGSPHANIMPSIALNYIICVQGGYPSPS
jgi:microcystin-dependent protein